MVMADCRLRLEIISWRDTIYLFCPPGSYLNVSVPRLELLALCPLRIFYIVNSANTRSTSLSREPIESHESHFPIAAYYFSYSGKNKSLEVAQIGKHYTPKH